VTFYCAQTHNLARFPHMAYNKSVFLMVVLHYDSPNLFQSMILRKILNQKEITFLQTQTE